MNKKVTISVMTALCAVFLLSAFMVTKQLLDSKYSNEKFKEIEKAIVSEPIVEDEKGETSSTKLTAYEKYKGLYALNNDFIGWINIADTKVNYPVMQTVYKSNYYLKHNFEKQYSDYGVPYVDEKCGIDLSNNTIIYGHQMKNGTMFSDLSKYTAKSFYEKNKVINYDTMTDFGVYEIVAVFKIDVDTDPFFYTNYTDMNEENFAEFISEIKAKAFYDTGITAEYGDKLLTLSTCEYTFKNGRLVVVAKRIAD